MGVDLLELAAVIAFGAIALYLSSRLSSRGITVSHIKGPSGAEWLVGHTHWLSNQLEANANEAPLFKEYGNVVRTKGCFNQDVLVIVDPKAIQYILQKTRYTFIKPNDDTTFFESMLGGHGGLLGSTGDEHAKQRRALLPAFSAAELRGYLETFQRAGEKLSVKLSTLLPSEGEVINVHRWTEKASLEAIGDTAFGHKFNALEGDHRDTELGAAMDNLLVDAQLFPSRYGLVFVDILRASPRWLCRLLNLLPTKQNDRLKQYRDAAQREVDRMIAHRRADPDGRQGKDVLNVLLQANKAENPDKRLDESEFAAIVTTLIIAGHDTTATALSWILWELAKSHGSQGRLRAEIADMHERVGRGKNFSATDYESMPFLNAVIKETLRFHSISTQRPREALVDDVIPLSEPLMTTKGEVTEIPVRKGQAISVNIAGYNRLKSVWGDDAEEWNPDRWLTQSRITKTGIGMTSNLLSFGGGVQGCIGWKFSIIEMQAILTQLLETFEFDIPKPKPRIVRVPVNVLAPMVEGEVEAGLQMPLHVKPLPREF